MYGILRIMATKIIIIHFFQLQLYLLKYRFDNVMHKNKNIITTPVRDGSWGDN